MGSMPTGWIQLLKQISREERAASRPCRTAYGTVKSVEPLVVSLNQKHAISEAIIDVPDYLTDYGVDVTINGLKQHGVIHNSLKTGDKIILLQNDGGQTYTVIGRI